MILTAYQANRTKFSFLTDANRHNSKLQADVININNTQTIKSSCWPKWRARRRCLCEKIDSITGQLFDPTTEVAAPRRDFSRQWQRRWPYFFFFLRSRCWQIRLMRWTRWDMAQRMGVQYSHGRGVTVPWKRPYPGPQSRRKLSAGWSSV